MNRDESILLQDGGWQMPSLDRSTVPGGHAPTWGCVSIPASPRASCRGFCSSSHPASALGVAAIGGHAMSLSVPVPREQLEEGRHQWNPDTASRLKGQENHLSQSVAACPGWWQTP